MRLGLIGFLFLVSACATSYQSTSFTGGFSDFPMGGNRHMIKVMANGYTSPERATQIAYVRAAELTVSGGYTHFLILGTL